MKRVSIFLFSALCFFLLGNSNVQAQRAFIAHIQEINSNLTPGDISGEAIFILSGDKLTITLAMKGLTPGMHLQHIHGFLNGKDATCPPSEADENNDGIIDLAETEPYAGTTMVPFTANPVDLKIKTDTYPVADKNGVLTYQKTISWSQLKAALKKTNHVDNFSLNGKVIFIHGIPEGTTLATTVKSLPGVPAQVTVPIACGKIEAL